jgi:hypothetical protein
MKPISFRRVFVVVGLMALVIIYILLWLRMISSQAERTGSDFISAYTGGRVAEQWGAANVYDLQLQQQVQAKVVGFELAPGQVLMFNHPPYLVPLLSLLMDENYMGSLARYAILMVALYALAMTVAWSLFRLQGWQKAPAALAVLGMVTFYPLFVSLVNTQDTALLLLGGVLVLFGLLTGRDWLAGLGLALTTVRPHVSVLLAVPFLFRRQRVFLWFSAAAATLGLVSLLSVGPGGMQAYLRLLLAASGGQFYGMQEGAMVNLVGLLTRLTPGLGGDAIHWIGWGMYAVTLVGLCVLWARSREISEKQIGLAVTLAVFAAPHLHYHDLTLLIVALAAALLILVREGFLHAYDAAIAPLALSLAFLSSNFAPVLKYNFPYAVVLLLVLVLWRTATLFRGRERASKAA